MKKVLLVFGTRPEAIKMAPLVKEFQKAKLSMIAVISSIWRVYITFKNLK